MSTGMVNSEADVRGDREMQFRMLLASTFCQTLPWKQERRRKRPEQNAGERAEIGRGVLERNLGFCVFFHVRQNHADFLNTVFLELK